MRATSFIGAIALLIACLNAASGQWTVVRLSGGARACGISASGITGFSGGTAMLWQYDTSDASWHVRFLNPPDVQFAGAYGIGDGQVVGYTLTSVTESHAALWSDSASSWMDLHPVRATSSVAYGVGGGVQVGSANINRFHACLWRGTPASWVDLEPFGAIWSEAIAGNAEVQVGYYSRYLTWDHATLWRGTAASFVDLHPATSNRNSYARAVYGDEQVGSAELNGLSQASLWRGTAESWVNLHPATMWDSSAYGVFNGIQVGYATTRGEARKHAALWRGSAATFEDLHLQLGPCFIESVARAIWQDHDSIYVVGYARNSGTGSDEAILWLLPATPFCPADLNHDGFVNGDDFDYFAEYFESGHPLADFNNDCFVNGNDYDRFAEAFEAGC